MPNYDRRQVIAAMPAALAGQSLRPKGRKPTPAFATGLFTELAGLNVPKAAKALSTSGYSAPGRGAGRYDCVAESDVEAAGQTLVLTAYLARTANGRWFELAEARPSVMMYGAVGDFTADDTAAIQQAIDHTTASGKSLIVPSTGKPYKLVPTRPIPAEDRTYPTFAALLMRSNLRIEAESGATFKIADNISSDKSPKAMGMFCTAEVLSNVSFNKLTMDMNGANNPISPSRRRYPAPDAFTRFTQAHILVSGTANGVAARIDNATVKACCFLNTAGVSCILMAQSNVAGVILGKGWSVTDNVFANNGLDTDDHSSIYAWCEGAVITGNTFEGLPHPGPTGGNVACELHGSNATFSHNTVRRYYQAVWVAENNTTDSINILVEQNIFAAIRGFGVGTFGQADPAKTKPAHNVTIRNNKIDFDNSIIPHVDLKIGVAVASAYAQRDIKIIGNTISGAGSPGTATAGIAIIAGSASGQKHDQIIIENNTVDGATFGGFLRTNAKNGLGAITLRKNLAHNLNPAGVFGAAAGISVGFYGRPSPIDSLVLDTNRCIDDRPKPRCATGVSLEGKVKVLTYRPGETRGVTAAAYRDDKLSVDLRKAQ